MIDGRYAEEHWRTIVETCVNDAGIEDAREPLEQAILEFRQAQSVALSMRDSARRRDQWEQVQTHAAALLKSIEAIEHWVPPSWGGDEEDPTAKKRALEKARSIVTHAEFCKDEYGSFVRGRNKPECAKLYHAVCQVWSRHIGRSLGWTKNGPFERFFRAALTPVLGDETPKGTGVRDIVQAEKERNSATMTSDGVISSARTA